jgi:hypothetical protein
MIDQTVLNDREPGMPGCPVTEYPIGAAAPPVRLMVRDANIASTRNATFATPHKGGAAAMEIDLQNVARTWEWTR